MSNPRCATHKYTLQNKGINKPRYVYGCLHCTHYLPVLDDIVGKKSICHSCSEEFVVNTNHIAMGSSKTETKPGRRVKLICTKCLKSKKIQRIEANFLQELGIK